MRKIAILGAGGHARVIAGLIRAIEAAGGDIRCAGFIAPEAGENVIGSDEDLNDLAASGKIDGFIVGIGSVRGGPSGRARVYDAALALGLEAVSAVHPAAVLADDIEIGPGTAVMAGAILNPGVKTGANVIINTGAIVDHDGQIRDHAHIAPGVVMSGDVIVGSRALVGVGACVRHGIRIGENATIGAGSVVISDVPDGAIFVGSPARSRQ